VSGNVAPETVNPSPLTVAEFTVTAAVPVELSVTVCVLAVFTETLPNARLVTLTPRVGFDAPSCSAKVCEALPALAVRVTVVAVVTEFTVAVKLPVLVPPANATLTGTVTALLLLARFTVNPLLAAAAFSVTVQLSVPAPVIALLVQVSPLNTGTPVPLNATVVDVPVDELLVNATAPVADPAAVGTYSTVSVAVWLGFNVSGKLAPDIVNPAPLIAPSLTITGAVPVELSVTVCVADEFTCTLPNVRLLALTLSVGTDAPS
jgi:hypothetical protein